MPRTKIFLIAIVLVFAIAAKGSASDEQTSEPRKTFTTSFYQFSDERSDVPVLHHRQRISHHGRWIADSDIDRIFIWKDGTIVWEVAPRENRSNTRWYQTKIPVEKVEAALRDIAESFAKYPSKDRAREPRMVFGLGADYAPSIKVHDSRHYESLGMEDHLWQFYQEHREVFQSGDNEAILKTFKTVGRLFDYRTLVEHYRQRQPQAGLSAPRTPVFSDAEVLKCAALFAADVEHLLLMEKKVLELLPSHVGLQARRINTRSQYVHVEREIKDGKSEFFYSRVSERERDEIRERLRAERERQ